MISAQRVSVQFVLLLRLWLVVGDVAAMAGRNTSVGILTSASGGGTGVGVIKGFGELKTRSMSRLEAPSTSSGYVNPLQERPRQNYDLGRYPRLCLRNTSVYQPTFFKDRPATARTSVYRTL